ncbi:MAG: HNH endonuclease signature motif containing protein [Anaerolineae bacterium]
MSFENSVRCHICGDCKFAVRGLQYDHVEDYANSGLTDPETGKPTHPFCNRNKKQILAHRAGTNRISLPKFIAEPDKRKNKDTGQQLRLPGFWGEEEFPQ